jgi:hypothetical protein
MPIADRPAKIVSSSWNTSTIVESQQWARDNQKVKLRLDPNFLFRPYGV